MKTKWIFLIFGALLVLSSCSTVKHVFALDDKNSNNGPIDNPFDAYEPPEAQKQNIVLRTKKGDRSVEVELPGGQGEMTDFVIPVSPAFKDDKKHWEEDPQMDQSYKEKNPSMADREITRSFPQASAEDEGARRDVENGLGVMPAHDAAPEKETSYLAAMDHIKRLYKGARYEAALLEIDDLIRNYPTDAKLHEMRGTLLDRMGRSDLALKSWNEALHLDPSNQSLKRFVERKQQKRSIASP